MKRSKPSREECLGSLFLGISGERSSIFAYFLAVGSDTPAFFAILAIGSPSLYISRIS